MLLPPRQLLLVWFVALLQSIAVFGSTTTPNTFPYTIQEVHAAGGEFVAFSSQPTATSSLQWVVLHAKRINETQSLQSLQLIRCDKLSNPLLRKALLQLGLLNSNTFINEYPISMNDGDVLEYSFTASRRNVEGAIKSELTIDTQTYRYERTTATSGRGSAGGSFASANASASGSGNHALFDEDALAAATHVVSTDLHAATAGTSSTEVLPRSAPPEHATTSSGARGSASAASSARIAAPRSRRQHQRQSQTLIIPPQAAHDRPIEITINQSQQPQATPLPTTVPTKSPHKPQFVYTQPSPKPFEYIYVQPSKKSSGYEYGTNYGLENYAFVDEEVLAERRPMNPTNENNNQGNQVPDEHGTERHSSTSEGNSAEQAPQRSSASLGTRARATAGSISSSTAHAQPRRQRQQQSQVLIIPAQPAQRQRPIEISVRQSQPLSAVNLQPTAPPHRQQLTYTQPSKKASTYGGLAGYVF